MSTEYATVYPYDNNNLGATYFSKKSSTYGFGDAILETSGRSKNPDGWNSDYSGFLNSKDSFFKRGGRSGNIEVNAGIFAFSGVDGGITNILIGFRSVLIAL